MKKIYILPQTAIFQTTAAHIFATSDVKLDSSEGNKLTDSNEILSKGAGEWAIWD